MEQETCREREDEQQRALGSGIKMRSWAQRSGSGVGRRLSERLKTEKETGQDA